MPIGIAAARPRWASAALSQGRGKSHAPLIAFRWPLRYKAVTSRNSGVESATFTEFIRRIRAGDEQAAADLVREYEPLIRREVRLHLEDRRLCRLFDSMDVCQSVLASFFVRTAVGEYDLDQPDQLVRLLVTMTRNKLASAARKASSQRRDHRRVSTTEPEVVAAVAGPDQNPDSLLAHRELLDRFRASLSDEE